MQYTHVNLVKIIQYIKFNLMERSKGGILPIPIINNSIIGNSKFFRQGTGILFQKVALKIKEQL